MKIKDLPEGIRKIAIERIREETFFKKIDIIKKNESELNEWDIKHSFHWNNTPEKHLIWDKVNNGNFEPFYKFHNILVDENKVNSIYTIPKKEHKSDLTDELVYEFEYILNLLEIRLNPFKIKKIMIAYELWKEKGDSITIQEVRNLNK